MAKPATILAAIAAAVLLLSSPAHAHLKDGTILAAAADDAQLHRFLRAEGASSSSHDAALVTEDGSLEHVHEEGAAFGKDNSAGHALPSADAGHDGKAPAQHDRHDKPRDKKFDGPHHHPSSHGHHGHGHLHHHASLSSSMAGRHDAGHHAAVPTPQNHGNTKGGDKHPGKKEGGSDRHKPTDVGYDDQRHPHLGSKKDVAHGHGRSDAHADKDATHKTAKSAKLASAGAGSASADAYLFTKHVDVTEQQVT